MDFFYSSNLSGLGATEYIDPSQPWLGTKTVATSTSFWDKLLNATKKASSVVQAAAPAVSTVSQQVQALKNGTYYPAGQQVQQGYNTPPVVKKDNTLTWLLIGLGVVAAGGIGYYALNQKKVGTLSGAIKYLDELKIGDKFSFGGHKKIYTLTRNPGYGTNPFSFKDKQGIEYGSTTNREVRLRK